MGLTFRKKITRPRRPRRKSRPLTNKNLNQKIKTISLRNCETKKSSHHQENEQLYHNRTDYGLGLLATTQGFDSPEGYSEHIDNRIGDEIIARGMKFKFWISNKADRPNCMYKIIAYQYNTDSISMNDIKFWRGTDGNGGVMNRMLDQTNPMKIKVLKSYLIKSGPNYSIPENGHEHSKLKEFYLPLNNRKIKYREDGDARPLLKDIGFAIVVYDSYGTLVTDNIASYAYSITFYYKDP